MAVVVSLVPYAFLPAKIGGQKGIALFNKYFSRHVKLICLTVNKNRNDLAEGYETIPLFSDSRWRYINPLYIFRVRRVLKEKKATHLLIEHPYYGWLALALKWITSVKLVVHSHNIEALRFKTQNKWWWKILWHYEKFTYRFADFLFLIHEEDRQYAIRYFGVKEQRCLVVTYGIENKQKPADDDMKKAKVEIREQYSIQQDEKVLLFTGSFNYGPNLEALSHIETHIVPQLLSKKFAFRVLVCGPWLEEKRAHPNIIYAGFVDDIAAYFKASDVFINPVTQGGGIKTKLVEALGFNVNAVSTEEGAIGVNPLLCNEKLWIVDNHDWEGFTDGIIKQSRVKKEILPAYFEHFYWGHSTWKAANFLTPHA
jgi:polysaccharide biosynthesis protein PslH